MLKPCAFLSVENDNAQKNCQFFQKKLFSKKKENFILISKS